MSQFKVVRLFTLFVLLLFVYQINAQVSSCVEQPKGSGNWVNPITGQKCVTTIQTSVGFMTITPDARSAAMGETGVALSPTAAASFFNGSALAFSEKKGEVQATFTPWLRALNLSDVYLANLNAYGKLDNLQTFYGSLRYFSLGNIDYTSENGQIIKSSKPFEMAVALGYARKLTENWSASLTGKFILSNLVSGITVAGTTQEASAASSGAADIGVTYIKPLALGNGATLRTGLSIKNIGSKVTYTSSLARDYIPTNMALGGSLEMDIDDYNSFTVALDFNKLLVPSPRADSPDENPANGRPDYLDKNPIEGIFSSFGDAQGGFSEEINEINTSIGLEYWYAKQFAARAGYFHEPNNKGGRKYLTIGVGLKYNYLGLDFSYLVPTSRVNTPLDNTLRFGLSYIFETETIED